MAELDGMRVATLEARMTGALASMISKRGGEPVCAPALREAPLDCADDVGYLLDRLAGNSIDVVVFQTGVGARALFAEADRQSRLDELLDALRGHYDRVPRTEADRRAETGEGASIHRHSRAVHDERTAGRAHRLACARQAADGAAIRRAQRRADVRAPR